MFSDLGGGPSGATAQYTREPVAPKNIGAIAKIAATGGHDICRGVPHRDRS